ncbi:hypothetical protein SMICM17S_11839 [Streptomyces microflavus]
MEGFDVSPTLPLAVGDDVKGLADMFRPYTALYVGGMGSRKQNFYNQLAQRIGYEKEAAEIQDKYLDGDKAGAAAAVPHQLIDQTTLLGPIERIAERMQAYAAAGVTALNLAPAGFTLEERLTALRPVRTPWSAPVSPEPPGAPGAALRPWWGLGALPATAVTGNNAPRAPGLRRAARPAPRRRPQLLRLPTAPGAFDCCSAHYCSAA